MKKKALKLTIVLLMVSLLLSACTGGSSGTPDDSVAEVNETTKKDSLVVRAVANPTTFDPIMSGDINEQMIHYQLHESLVRLEQDGTLVPAIAETWEFSDDATELKVTIREDVKFHNGDIVSADDVVFSINRSIESPFTSKVTSVIEKADKIDEKTVLITLKHPYAPIIGCMSSSFLSIVPKKVVETDPEGFQNNPIGAGPYMFKEFDRGERIKLEAFPDYYRGEARIKDLTYRIITDSTTALMSLEKGEIDMGRPSQSNVDKQAILDNPNLIFHEDNRTSYSLIAFNTEKGIFSDKKLREAVSYAVDREGLVEGATNGEATPLEAAMPLALAEYYPKDFKGHELDLDKAKRLMEEAGYSDGFTITAKVINAENYTKPIEIIQEQLRHIGITVKIEAMERGAWFSDVMSGGDYEMTCYGFAIPVLDPDFATHSYFHSSMADGKGNNLMNVKNPELDKILDAARISQDNNERYELYEKFCDIVRDESYIIPTYVDKRTKAANSNLKGLIADPNMRYEVYNYYWE